MGSAAWLMHAGHFFRLHQWLKPVIGSWLAVNDRNGFFFQVASKEVTARVERVGDNNDNDIVGHLLSTQTTKPQLPSTSIAFMMTSNVLAGSDSTAIALRAIVYLVLSQRSVHDRFVQELRQRQMDGRLSRPVRFH